MGAAVNPLVTPGSGSGHCWIKEDMICAKTKAVDFSLSSSATNKLQSVLFSRDCLLRFFLCCERTALSHFFSGRNCVRKCTFYLKWVFLKSVLSGSLKHRCKAFTKSGGGSDEATFCALDGFLFQSEMESIIRNHERRPHLRAPRRNR